MKYKVGDKVRIKTWDEMEREFGLDGEDINCYLTFVPEMRIYEDSILTITFVGSHYYEVDEDDGAFAWSDDMISYKVLETSVLYEEALKGTYDNYIKNDVESVMGAYEHYFDFDPVDKPQHYANKEIEVIDYIQDTLSDEEFEGYCMGNVIKYVSRYKHKNGVEDLKKARYYLNKAIDLYKMEVE
jgi:hypothetical protein